jgi:hypothetical protein
LLQTYFGDVDSRTICPDWLWTTIFLISASQVAKISGVFNKESWKAVALLVNTPRVQHSICWPLCLNHLPHHCSAKCVGSRVSLQTSRMKLLQWQAWHL